MNKTEQLSQVSVINRVGAFLESKSIQKVSPDIVKACGFGRKFFAQVVRGEKQPTIEQLVKLSIALDTDLNNLFEVKNQSNKTN